MHADRGPLNDLSERVIGCAFTVQNVLGAGFLEKVYENALAHELRNSGLTVVQGLGIAIRYGGIVVGQYFADLLVESRLLIELKAVKTLDEFTSGPMYQLPQSHRAPTLLTAELRQATPGDQAHRE